MHHNKYEEVKTLVNVGQSVLLTGERGSGKTTLAKHVTEGLELPFYSMSMTRQTTLSHLMGFISVNGAYIPTQLRKAVEEGGVMLLDEIDAADANVLLSLNTIENGYVSFPDKIVELHKDFRLIATSNPQDNHRDYNGRSKLDAATLDRFDIINVERDGDLEATLVDGNTLKHIELARQCLKGQNSSTYISMRDTLRYQVRKDLGLIDGFIKRIMHKDQIAYENYEHQAVELPETTKVEECTNIKELWDHMTFESGIK